MDDYNRSYDASCNQTTSSAYAVLMRNIYTWMASGIGLTAYDTQNIRDMLM